MIYFIVICVTDAFVEFYVFIAVICKIKWNNAEGFLFDKTHCVIFVLFLVLI